MLASLQRYMNIYSSIMQVDVKRLVDGCALCYISNLANWSWECTLHLVFSLRPRKTISVELLRGLPITSYGYDYLLLLLDLFDKMGDLYSLSDDYDLATEVHRFSSLIYGYILFCILLSATIGTTDFKVAFGLLYGH